MRALAATLLAAFAAPLLLAACSGDQAPLTGPATVPDLAPAMAVSASRSAPIDPSHTYRFDFTCSAAAAANSLVHITNDGVIGSINVTCNSGTELGAAYGTTFGSYGVEITLDSPTPKVCTQASTTRTGTFRCKSQKYSAALTVTDEGVLPISY